MIDHSKERLVNPTYELNETDIIQSVETLILPGHPFEVRIIGATAQGYPQPHPASGYFDNTTDLITSLKCLESYQGIYIVLNPIFSDLIERSRNTIKHTLKEATDDTEITSRRWLFIDVDPVRPAYRSSSEEEHTYALSKIQEIRNRLYQCGWPLPLTGDSGNGAHLLYSIDIPTHDDTLIKRVLEGLAAQFDDEQVKIDIKVHNPSRISKLYGTWACKGESTEDYPHRIARILEIPEVLESVPSICLKAVALPDIRTYSGPRTYTSTSIGNNAYGEKALQEECDLVARAPVGNRNNQLNTSAYSLGQLVGGNVLSRSTVERELFNAAIANGTGDSQSSRTIRSGIEAGIKNPRGVPERRETLVEGRIPTPMDLPEYIAEHDPPAGGGDGNGNGNGHPPVSDDDLLNFEADDSGNGDAMFALYGHKFYWCGSRGWLAYNGKYWDLDSEGAEVRRCIVDTLRRRRHAAVNASREPIVRCAIGDEKRVNGCLNRFKTLVNILIDQFDREPDFLNCQNGVVDLRDGSIQPHSREQLFTYCVPVEYGEADPQKWMDYLYSVVGGGQEVIDYLQLALGYSITGHTREEILFYLYGPPRSGKGTISELFMALMPSPLSTGVDFNSFTAKREGDVSNFDLAPLKPSRLIFASESNRGQSLNPAKIKQLTGGDRVRACYKHKDFFEYRPQFKVWMISNWAVNGDPEDDALWGRVRVIPFPNSFLGVEDKTKKSSLRDPDTLKSVLYWTVQGAMKWYALGAKGLATPEPIQNATKSHRDEMDYVKQWLDEECERSEGSWTANEEIAASYTAWCKNNNVQYPKGPRALAQSLQREGFITGKQRKEAGKNKKGVEGLFLPPKM